MLFGVLLLSDACDVGDIVRDKVQLDFLKDYYEVICLPRMPKISTAQIKRGLKDNQNG